MRRLFFTQSLAPALTLHDNRTHCVLSKEVRDERASGGAESEPALEGAGATNAGAHGDACVELNFVLLLATNAGDMRRQARPLAS